MSGEPLCGSESPASVTVDDSVTSSASDASVVSEGSEGSSVVVKRFRKRPLPEHDPPEESLLLDHAASPRTSEVAISNSPSSFVLIGPRETFFLPSPKFAVRPRSGLLQDSAGPVFRRELAPNWLDGFSRPASVRPHRTPLSCNPLPAPFFALRGLSERCEPSQPLPVPVYGSARDYATRPFASVAAAAADKASAAVPLSSCASSPQLLSVSSRPVSSPAVSRPRFSPGSGFFRFLCRCLGFYIQFA